MQVTADLILTIQRLSTCKTLDQIMQVLRDSTRDLTGADGVTVVLRDVDKCHYAEENAISPLWKGKRFPMSACISGWCMIHKQQVVIKDIYADERIPHDAYRPTFVKSLAMTPIRTADPVGAIGAYWASQHEATPAELSILQALGDSAALALENSQLIEQLKESNRRKDEFLSMLAHELRNPLAPIRNGLHLIRMQDSQPEPVEEACQIMDRQVVHLSNIVNDLLDVARVNNGKVTLKKARIDLVALVRQLVKDHRAEFEAAKLTLTLDLPATPVWILADAMRLNQAIGNVLDNAGKYTPGGGTVTVRLAIDDVTRDAVVEVADTGVGIAQPLLPKIFEAFTQADTSLDRTGGGLGIGLAVANGFVKLHDGTISAFSDGPGQGATFRIALPGVQVDETPAASNGDGKANGKLHVLIIEDNRDTADSLQRVLKMCGYSTSVAYDGSEGITRARGEKPDIVLCDIGLPEVDGYGVARMLRADRATAGTRLIAVTGYGSDEDRERTREAGFDSHMVKPVDLKALLAQMQSPQVAA